ncbi:Gfo/Idh/MocA family oxidoreductase [Devosia algicola]|uniref:Gfo/Idh/MocA family oxidoreductase n=1 Tax=Devosia algicola TaxID=3026418 RepID=UPI003898DFB5
MVSSFEEDLALKPDLVSINTHTDTHARFAIAAMKAACMSSWKPLVADVEDAKQVVEVAQRLQCKLVGGCGSTSIESPRVCRRHQLK